jgi:gliding motility-associated-like protein
VTVCDNAGHCDDTTVTITVLDCLIQAVDEPCDLTETPMNTPITIDVLANDIIPQAADTTIQVIGTIQNGTATEDEVTNTITVVPANNFQGEITFSYIVCAVTGTQVLCDTANVCVTVEDTTCYIPNAFSPNGDGTNDLFVIPCNEDNEQATLRIYDRWGVEVWFSNGHYLDDFAGKNMQGTELPDGTYYLIYDYNNGSGKREAKFVVIHR